MVVLPEPLRADDVIGGGCGLFTGFAAVDRSGLPMGSTVLVQGSGPVGLSAVAAAIRESAEGLRRGKVLVNPSAQSEVTSP